MIEIPDSFGALISLERLSLSNNQIKKISDQIGRLSKLEELSLNGNPLNALPKGLGCCISMEVINEWSIDWIYKLLLFFSKIARFWIWVLAALL